MTAWLDNLAAVDQSLIAWVEIVGVGSSSGSRYRFSTSIGWSLAAGDGIWMPLLEEWPDILSQEVDAIEGGTAKFSGSLSFSIVDQDDALTSLFRLSNRTAQAVLRGDVTESDAVLPVSSTSGISTNTIIWFGSEAAKVIGVDAINRGLSVTRAQLGTVAVAHRIGTAINLEPRLLGGRRADLYVAALDGGEANKELVGSYIIDSVSWSDEHAAWTLKARTRQLYLDRKSPRNPAQTTVREVRPVDTEPKELMILESVTNGLAPVWSSDGQTTAAISDGEAIVQVEVAFNLGSRRIIDIGHAGAKRAEPEPGPWRQVMSVANGDFRVAPGGTTGTRTGWTETEHVVDILLNILTSSATDDGLTLNNADATYGNWSGLPAGYGLSVPISDIDVESFIQVRQRWGDAIAPNFVLGLGKEEDETPTFRDVADELLKPLGWYITQERGRVRLVAPKLPDGSTAALQLGPADILVSSDEEGVELPRFTQEMAYDSVISSYVLRFGRDGEAAVTVSVEDQLQRLFNPEDLFQLPSNDVELEIPHVGERGRAAYILAAQNRLMLAWQAYVRAHADMDPERTWEWKLAENAALTMPGVVDPTNGTRGFVNAIAQLTKVEPDLSEDEGLVMKCSMLIQPSLNISRVAPAARVVSVTGTGPYVVTVSTNRYTETDATGLPVKDAGDGTLTTFKVGDVLRLRRENRSYHASTATITAIDDVAQTITLDDNFSGNIAAGKVLVTALADDATQDQLARYAFMASRGDYLVGTTSEVPAVYGGA